MSWFLTFFKYTVKFLIFLLCTDLLVLTHLISWTTTTTKIQTVPSPSPTPSSLVLLPRPYPRPLAAADLVSIPILSFWGRPISRSINFITFLRWLRIAIYPSGLHVSEVSSFLLPSVPPVRVFTLRVLIRHPEKDSWVVSRLGQIGVQLLKTFVLGWSSFLFL